MTLVLDTLRKYRSDGEIEVMSFDPRVSVIVGPPNSSKTTSLRMIDFCLGDADPADRALGPAIVENYLGLELDLSVSGTRYTVRRGIQSTFGLLTRVRVGDADLALRDFQAWLMRELDWPELSVPKGRDPRVATELVPLTFRSLLRHIYRKENSWLDFASREEEFLRRAVIAYFLGFAEALYFHGGVSGW